ncbi:unnamed protein product [Toxocara canis]|uniref:Transcriptional regulator n=1 Tax=Toxocara canis TaxID=6265 RepID=A0A183UFV5_TOXCA|nr:unnamed protein product [Toxocara canis]
MRIPNVDSGGSAVSKSRGSVNGEQQRLAPQPVATADSEGPTDGQPRQSTSTRDPTSIDGQRASTASIDSEVLLAILDAREERQQRTLKAMLETASQR